MSASAFLRRFRSTAVARDTAVTGSTVVGTVSRAGTVSEVTYTTTAAITGAATNSRTVSLVNKKADGSGTTVIATLAFVATINTTAFVAKTIPLSGTAANLEVAAGDVLAWVSTAVGTGLADPGGLATVSVLPS